MGEYDDLLERAKWEPGTVTPDEIATVAALLLTAPEGERYTLLHILGCAGNPAEHRIFVEPYLAGPDEQLARLAVWILCGWWELTPEYRDDLLRFLRGVEWDWLEEVRWAAASTAGGYLHDHSDPDLLEALLETYNNKNNEHSVRQYAFYGLAEAVGGDLSDHPPRYEDIALDPPPDPTVITKALKRLVDERMAEVNAQRTV